MAGDWIPVRIDLQDDPAVIGISLAVKLDEFSVVGRLIRLWSWASSQTQDGFIPFVTPEKVDQIVQRSGFAAATAKVGWLVFTDDGLTIPNFDRWMSESSKKRFAEVLKKRRQRVNKKCPQNRGHSGDIEGDNLGTPIPLSLSLEGVKEGGLGETIGESPRGSAPRDGQKVRDGPADGQSWAIFLAQEWIFRLAAGSHGQKDPYEAAKFFQAVLDRGISGPEILGKIRLKDRPRTQPIWEFENAYWPRPRAKGNSNGESVSRHHSEQTYAAAMAKLLRAAKSQGEG